MNVFSSRLLSSFAYMRYTFPSLMCSCNTKATCLINAQSKHASLSLPLGSNTHTYRVVMIFSDGVPSFTRTTCSCTTTNDHLVSTIGITYNMCTAVYVILQILNEAAWRFLSHVWGREVAQVTLTGFSPLLWLLPFIYMWTWANRVWNKCSCSCDPKWM